MRTEPTEKELKQELNTLQLLLLNGDATVSQAQRIIEIKSMLRKIDHAKYSW